MCTSSNARAVLTWALDPEGTGRARGDKVLFFPDQHLGRNTGFQLGYGPGDMAVWNPRAEFGGPGRGRREGVPLLLWKGHCSVHQRFRPEHVAAFRAEHPEGIVVVHPECAHDVVEAGRPGRLHRLHHPGGRGRPGGRRAGGGHRDPPGTRLADEHPDKTVVCLDPLVCPCSTMSRIDPPHLAWVLEGLVAGEVRNRIVVEPEVARLGPGGPRAMLATT